MTDPEPNTVAYLRIRKAELEAKDGWVRPTVGEFRELLGLDEDSEGEGGLDEKGLEVYDDVRGAQVVEGDTLVDEAQAASDPGSVRFGRHGRWFAITAEGRANGDVGDELHACFDALKGWLLKRRETYKHTLIADRLAAEHLSLQQAAHITLLLSSMADFPAANTAYIRYFGTSPPSRATVAVPLPRGQRIRVEVVGFDDQAPEGRIGARSALHVQGLSYWAPANIGPYSQAVTVRLTPVKS